MDLRFFQFLVLGLGPVALTACVELEPAVTEPQPAATAVGVDLGGSSRIPRVARPAGTDDGGGRTERPVRMARVSMPGMSDGSTGGMQMDHGPMPGMRHSAREGTQMAQAQAQVQGSGVVNSVDPAARKVNMTHDPIPAIGWPAMTMDFQVAPSADLRAAAPGARVNFQMQQGQGGMYVIQSISPAAGGRR
jgi:Cu/Ag efflux protein CusF